MSSYLVISKPTIEAKAKAIDLRPETKATKFVPMVIEVITGAACQEVRGFRLSA